MVATGLQIDSFIDNCLGIPMSTVPFTGSFSILKGQWVHVASMTTSQTIPNSESATAMHSDEAVAQARLPHILYHQVNTGNISTVFVSVTKPIRV